MMSIRSRSCFGMIPLLLLLLAHLQCAWAFWRMPCHKYEGLFRIDPIVSPGVLSEHAHSFHGSSGVSMDATVADLVSSCTSCEVEQDKSSYWAPSLMFQHQDGTFEPVQELGPMLAYYQFLPRNSPPNHIKAFPPGFKMVSGDSHRRNFSLPLPVPEKSLWAAGDIAQSALAQKAIGFNCLHYGSANEGAVNRHSLPDKAFIDANCYSGLRLELAFPSCWNGRDLDSPDHRSHVAYSSLVIDGDCPAGFETRLPFLFFETIYDTPRFKDIPGRFVLGNGDPSGFGYHGDFIAGWDAAFLQNAINTCRDPSGDIHACPIFTIKKRTEAQNCRFIPPKVASEENCGARRDELCGGVQIQSGPQPATSAAEPAPIANDTPTPVSPPAVKVQQVTPFAVADLPSQTRSYRTEYSTMNGKRVMVLIEETTVTDVETEFVKRSVASEASVAAHQRRHGHGHGHNRHV